MESLLRCTTCFNFTCVFGIISWDAVQVIRVLDLAPHNTSRHNIYTFMSGGVEGGSPLKIRAWVSRADPGNFERGGGGLVTPSKSAPGSCVGQKREPVVPVTYAFSVQV